MLLYHVCISTVLPSDETASRKKPRLGWGEALAKYERKKDGPDDGPNISGISSPRVSYYSDFPSPTTPSSVAWSSSPVENVMIAPRTGKWHSTTTQKACIQYYADDGQLSWFNAGVRVGVGIGLIMCLGVGIGVGLLMRSYLATISNFRRRFCIFSRMLNYQYF